MPDRLLSMTRDERADGTGDLIFEQLRQSMGSGSTIARRGIVAVERVGDLENLILSTLLANRSRPK